MIFVRHALTGEVVDARITSVNRRFARADAVAVHRASPHRVTPALPDRGSVRWLRLPARRADPCPGAETPGGRRAARAPGRLRVHRRRRGGASGSVRLATAHAVPPGRGRASGPARAPLCRGGRPACGRLPDRRPGHRRTAHRSWTTRGRAARRRGRQRGGIPPPRCGRHRDRRGGRAVLPGGCRWLLAGARRRAGVLVQRCWPGSPRALARPLSTCTAVSASSLGRWRCVACASGAWRATGAPQSLLHGTSRTESSWPAMWLAGCPGCPAGGPGRPRPAPDRCRSRCPRRGGREEAARDRVCGL